MMAKSRGVAARMDPWCMIRLDPQTRILFGFATYHPCTLGLSWMHSTPVRHYSESGGTAYTESGRVYSLGRRFLAQNLPAEGIEAQLAYELLIGRAADELVPAVEIDPLIDGLWLTACKMARHLKMASPARTPDQIIEFLNRNGPTYAALRRKVAQ
jgi:hypothetical protein